MYITLLELGAGIHNPRTDTISITNTKPHSVLKLRPELEPLAVRLAQAPICECCGRAVTDGIFPTYRAVYDCVSRACLCASCLALDGELYTLLCASDEAEQERIVIDLLRAGTQQQLFHRA